MSLKQKTSINNQTNCDQHHLDTGWAWIILVASFMIATLSSGIFSSLGIFLVVWQDQLSGSLTQLQWILSLVIGIPLIIGKNARGRVFKNGLGPDLPLRPNSYPNFCKKLGPYFYTRGMDIVQTSTKIHNLYLNVSEKFDIKSINLTWFFGIIYKMM